MGMPAGFSDGFSEHNLYRVEELADAVKKRGLVGSEPIEGYLQRVDPDIPVKRTEGAVGGRGLPYLLYMWAKGFPPDKSSYVKVLEDVLVGPAWPEVMGLLEALVEVSPIPLKTETRAEKGESRARNRPEPHPQREDKGEEGESKRKSARKGQDLASPTLDELLTRLDLLEKRFKNLEEFLLEDFPSIVRGGLDAEVGKATALLNDEFAQVKKEVNVWREHVRYANDTLHRFGQRLDEMERAIKEMGRKLSALEEALQKIKDRIAGFVR
jgi:hypothetical protein